MCRDLEDLIRGIVAYGMDALLGASRRQNHQETTGLIRYVPPTILGSFWNGNAGIDRCVEHLIFDQGSDKSRRALRDTPLHCGEGALAGCNRERQRIQQSLRPHSCLFWKAALLYVHR